MKRKFFAHCRPKTQSGYRCVPLSELLYQSKYLVSCINGCCVKSCKVSWQCRERVNAKEKRLHSTIEWWKIHGWLNYTVKKKKKAYNSKIQFLLKYIFSESINRSVENQWVHILTCVVHGLPQTEPFRYNSFRVTTKRPWWTNDLLPNTVCVP